jgi:hypothetical protein
MTQNEKLRTLLSEARDCLLSAQGVWRERNEDTYADSASELTARIDAALAEPVTGNCLRCWALNELRVSDQRKNDEAQTELRSAYAELQEARAEVERLNALLDGVVGACKYACNRESHCGVCAIAFKGISP